MISKKKAMTSSLVAVVGLGWSLLPILYDLVIKPDPKPTIQTVYIDRGTGQPVRVPTATPEQIDAAMLYLSEHATINENGVFVINKDQLQ